MQLQTAADFQSHSSKWNYQNNLIYIKEAEFGHTAWGFFVLVFVFVFLFFCVFFSPMLSCQHRIFISTVKPADILKDLWFEEL